MAIKCRLKVLLAENDMTQKELAEKIGARLPTINDMCNNKIKHIPVKLLDDICNYFNCSLSELIKHEKIFENNEKGVDK